MQSVVAKNRVISSQVKVSTKRGASRACSRKRARNLLSLAAAGAIGGLLTHSARAAVDTYTGANNGAWETGSNWSTLAAPTNAQNALINNSVTVLSTGNNTAAQIEIGVGANYNGGTNVAGNGNLTISSGNLSISGMAVGDGGTGTVIVSGGNLTGNGSSTIFIGASTAAYAAAGSGNFTLSSGTVTTAGALVDIGDFSSGVMNVSGGTFTNTNILSIGNNGNGSGIVNVSGGNVSLNQLSVQNSGSTGGNDFFNQSGGNVTVNNNAGNTFRIGRGNAGGSGAYNLTGGTLTVQGTDLFIATNGTSNGVLNVGGSGNLTLTGTSSLDLDQVTAGTTVSAVVNQTGGNVTLASTSTNGVWIGNQNASPAYNLQAGTLTTPFIKSNGTGKFNFNGGTLVANGNATQSASFLTGLASSTIFSGGATINTNGLAVTIGQALLAPTGSGVTNIALTGNGSRYFGSPLVTITGGGGTGAAAVANVVNGNITGFTITNPGQGYTSAPTVTLAGDLAAGGTAAVVGTVTTAANSTTGGLTVTGGGTLTLTGASTYQGPTVVSAGTLQAGVATNGTTSGAFGVNSAVTLANVAGVTLNLNNFNNSIGSLTGGGATGGNVTLGNATLTVGTNNTSPAAFAGVISGTGNVTKTGTGILTLSGSNTYSGVTTINGGGALDFTQKVALYGGNTTLWNATNLVVNAGGVAAFGIGGAGQFTLSDFTTLAALGNATGGFKAGSSIGIDTSAGGNLTLPTFTNNANSIGLGKLGTNTLTVAGNNTYTGPTVVMGGTLLASGPSTVVSGNTTSGAFGVKSAIVFGNFAGATLSLNGFDQQVGSLAGGGGTGGTISLGSGNLTTGEDGTSTSYAGVITGTGTLTKIGAGTQTLTNAGSSFTGNIVVNGGNLTASTGGASNGNTDFGSFANPGRTITINAGGRVNLTANNVFGDVGALPANLPVITINGGTLSNTSYNLFGNVTLQNGAQIVTSYNNGTGTYQSLVLLGTVTVNGNSSSSITNSGTSGINLAANTIFNVSTTSGTGPDLTINGVGLGNNSPSFVNGAGGFTKTGNGSMLINAPGVYTGTTTIENGALLIGNATALGSGTSAIALGDATSISGNLSPSLLTNGAFAIARNFTVGSANTATTGAYTIGGNTGGGNTSIFSGTETLNQNLTVAQVSGGTTSLTGNITSGSSGTQTLTFNNAGSISQSTGVIGGGTGTIAVVQSGAGVTTISGANSYTGGTTVNAGTLIVTNTSGSATGSGPVQVNGGAVLTGTGTISGPVTVAAGNTTATQGTISLLPASILTLGNLTLGDPGGNSSNLLFQLTGNTSNKLVISGPVIMNAGGAIVTLQNQGIVGNTTYNLATFADNGSLFNGGNFTNGTGTSVDGFTTAAAPFGTTSNSLTVTVNSGGTDTLQLTTGVVSPAPAQAYWTGAVGSSWNSLDGNGIPNFSQDNLGATPVAAYPAATTDVYFAASVNGNMASNLTNTLGQNFDIQSLTFLATDGSNNTIAAINIGGTALNANTLQLEGGNGNNTSPSFGNSLYNANVNGVTLGMTTIVPNVSQTWTNALGAGNLTINSAVTGTAATGNSTVLTLSSNSTNPITINGVISDGAGGGNLSVNINGNATRVVSLTASNSFTGALTLTSGILNVPSLGNSSTNSPIGFGASAASLVLNGGTLQYTGTTAQSTNRLFTLGTNGGTIDGSGNGAAALLTFTGNTAVSFVGSGNRTLTLTGSNTGVNRFVPVIGDQSVGNSTSLIKSGNGTWALSSSNSFTGGTIVSAGVLGLGLATNTNIGNGGNTWTGNQTSNTNPLGTGNITVTAGASFELDLPGTAINLSNNITLNGVSYGTGTGNGHTATNGGVFDGAFVGGTVATETTTLSGTITLNADSNFSASWNDKLLVLSGQVTGNGGLIVDPIGAGRNGTVLQLSNNTNNYLGNTTISPQGAANNAPILETGAVNVIPTTSNVFVNGILDLDGNSQAFNALNGNGTVTSSGSGAQTLSIGNNNGTGTFSGIISNSASLATGLNGTRVGNGTIALIKTGNGTQILSNASSSFTGNVTINGGTLSATSGGTGGGNTTLGSDAVAGRTITVNNGGTLSFTSNDVFGGTGSANIPTITINAGGNVTTTRYNQLGNITLSGGTLVSNSSDNTANFQGYALPSTVTVNGNSASTISSLNAVVGNTTFGGEHLAATTIFNVASTGATTDLTVSAPLRNQGSSGAAASLVKAGNGTMLLSGANTFTGQTTISAGTLAVNAVATGANPQPLGENGNLTVGGSSTSGTLGYTGGNGTLDKSITIGAGSGTISNTGGGVLTLSGTINKNAAVLNLSGGSFVISNVISGASAGSDLNVIGGAIVGETLANTYNGPTSISGNSTLLTGVNNALPSGNLTNLTLGAPGGSSTFTNTLDLLGTSQSVASLNAAGNATNQIISSNGSATTPAIGGSASSGAGSLTIAYSGNSTDTYGGTLGDAGAVLNNFSVIMSGNGTLALTGINTYLGGTTINAGTLALAPTSGTNNIASSKFIAVGAGATFNVANVGGAGANAFALNGTGTQATSQIVGGTGTVAGTLSIANGVTLSAGTNKGTGQVNVAAGPTFTLVPATGTTDTIGTLTTGNLALGAATGASANFAVKVSDAVNTGTPGGTGNPGTAGTNYDTVIASGITVPTTPANPFNVQMLSYGTLGSPVANTASANFDGTATYVWQIASYTSTNIPDSADNTTVILTSGGGQIADPNASGLFTLDTTNFLAANPGAIPGAFFLEEIGGTGGAGTLDIGYNSTPEPGTTLLVLAGAMPMLAARRRRRQKASAEKPQ